MLRNDPERSFFIVWLVTVAAICTIAGIAIVRLSGPLAYSPVVVDALGPTTINLNDQRKLHQTFVAPERNISHVGIHVANARDTDPQAVVTVRILDTEQQVLFSGHAAVANLREDDVTLIPARMHVTPGTTYTLELSTHGVPAGSDLLVYYEGDSRGFPEGEAQLRLENVNKETEVRALTGNVRFQILRYPTLWLVTDTFLHTRTAWLLAACGIMLLVGLLLRRRLIRWWMYLAPPLPLRPVPFTWRELVFPAVLAGVLALIVTLPYYTQLNEITTMGDVQRALVYRAVARTALLQHGEVGLWDPYLCGGEPLLANMESAHLDPFFPLVLFVGENLGTRLSVTATLIIGFLGTYLVARRFGRLPRLSALLAAGIFPFAGFQMLAFANGNFAWIPVGWIPWVVYFFLLGTTTPSARTQRSLSSMRYYLLAAMCVAFIFLGGSLHMTLYALLACGFLALFFTLVYRSWRPVAAVLCIAMLFVPLVAIKLLPVAEVQAIAGDFNRPPPYIQPWQWLGKMLWDRTQLSTPQWTYEATGENFRWIEYGTYIGIIPVVLLVLGAIAARRKRFMLGILGAATLLLLMTFGEFPWTVLHTLPFLYGPLRNPQRARVVWLLFAGIVAGFGLATALRPLRRWRRAGTAVGASIVAFVLLDMVLLHAPLYQHLFNLPVPPLAASPSFIRRHESYTDYEAHGYYKVGYENYRAGEGVTDLCMPYMVQRGVAARGVGSSNPTKPYFGEAQLSAGGTIDRVEVANNEVRVSLTTENPGWLILNQNFFPGWRTTAAHEVVNHEGLVAARVTPADTEVHFVYRPRSYTVGLLLTTGSLVIGMLVVILLRATPHTSAPRRS